MKYKTLKYHINDAIKFSSKKYHMHTLVKFDFERDDFVTRKSTSEIIIGLSKVYGRDDIMFTDAVELIINTFHECYHAVQFQQIRNSNVLTDDVIAFGAEYGNQYYYYQMYHHSTLELDAEYEALNNARKYLHKKYKGYEDVIDKHLLYWGNKWFEDPMWPDRQYLNPENCIELDDFLVEFDRYRRSHWSRSETMQYDIDKVYGDNIWNIMNKHVQMGRYHLYDACFMNTHDIKLQREAALLINLTNNDELLSLVPAFHNLSELEQIKSNVMNYESTSVNDNNINHGGFDDEYE